MALTPEVLVPRIGDTLVEQKLLTLEQLNDALSIQKQERAAGKLSLIGQVLVEHEFISQQVLDQAITQQILQLHNALRQVNATLEQRVKDRTQELEIAYQKLSELAALKANFVSNISHELRTPLTHIKGYVNLLMEADFSTLLPDQQHALTVIDKASARLGRMIEDLILFSTSETSSLHITKKNIDVVKIARQVIEQQKDQADAKKIRLSLESSNDQLEIKSDGQLLFWVINQLVDNAIKFTSTGGSTLIGIHAVDRKINVTVTDTGMGIAPGKLEEIFEPFHQLDESTTRLQGGTGLGLTLARKIIEALGSTLSVTSTFGKGSIFQFSLER